MRLFKEYLLVGGVPRSVVAYIEGGRDFFAADAEKRDILELYRDDIKRRRSVTARVPRGSSTKSQSTSSCTTIRLLRDGCDAYGGR